MSGYRWVGPPADACTPATTLTGLPPGQDVPAADLARYAALCGESAAVLAARLDGCALYADADDDELVSAAARPRRRG